MVAHQLNNFRLSQKKAANIADSLTVYKTDTLRGG